MASLEFEDYALNWWEQVQDLRVEQGLPQICTWEEMKQVMRLRFVPQHYTRDLYQRLQTLKQGYKTVEEYYKEMELAMIRANVKKSEEQAMARFLNGLNYQVKKITNFQPYKTVQELVHQATKEERQVQEDAKYSKFVSSNTRVLLLTLLLFQEAHPQVVAIQTQDHQILLLLELHHQHQASNQESHPTPFLQEIQRQALFNASRARAVVTRHLSALPSAP